MRQQLEHNEQVIVMQWAKLMEGKYPELELLHACPNGGQRNIITAVKLKAEGVKPGCPDLHLPAMRGVFGAMFLEMKAAKGKLSDLQKHWIELLTSGGYYCVVCYSAEEAIEAIETYLNLPKP